MRALLKFAGHGVLVLVLTLLTQLGGLAWLAALGFRRRLVAFVLVYAALWLGAQATAPAVSGREPLPCFGAPLRSQSVFYCATLRNFAAPEMVAVAEDAAAEVAARYPGTITLTLDAGFPFWNGFPLLPHLSHDDGEKLDLAFYYADPDGGYRPGITASPLGYFAFAVPDTDLCPDPGPLRWNLRPLQPLWRDDRLEPVRTAALLQALARDPRVGRIFVEPPIARDLGVTGGTVGFQGCRAARHDDHIHLQL
ncbi:MAG: hypothetical protein AAF914_04785 [Pseudomonadota bacterium]